MRQFAIHNFSPLVTAPPKSTVSLLQHIYIIIYLALIARSFKILVQMFYVINNYVNANCDIIQYITMFNKRLPNNVISEARKGVHRVYLTVHLIKLVNVQSEYMCSQ